MESGGPTTSCKQPAQRRLDIQVKMNGADKHQAQLKKRRGDAQQQTGVLVAAVCCRRKRCTSRGGGGQGLDRLVDLVAYCRFCSAQ